jgi:hypothetical protein
MEHELFHAKLSLIIAELSLDVKSVVADSDPDFLRADRVSRIPSIEVTYHPRPLKQGNFARPTSPLTF